MAALLTGLLNLRGTRSSGNKNNPIYTYLVCLAVEEEADLTQQVEALMARFRRAQDELIVITGIFLPVA